MNVFQDVIHSIYDIRNVTGFTNKGLKCFFSFICILAILVTMFTTVIPAVRVLTQLRGVNSIITYFVPDFTYENKELSTEYFDCKIDEEKNTIFMIDTNRKLDDVILNEYSSGTIVDKEHFAIKNSSG